MRNILKKVGIGLLIAAGILFLLAASVFLSVHFHRAMHLIERFF